MEDIHMKKIVSILLIFVLIFAMSAAVFADNATSPEKGNTDVDPDNPPASPQTGDNGMIFWVIAAMILAVGVVAFCGKKLVGER